MRTTPVDHNVLTELSSLSATRKTAHAGNTAGIEGLPFFFFLFFFFFFSFFFFFFSLFFLMRTSPENPSATGFRKLSTLLWSCLPVGQRGADCELRRTSKS